MRVRTHDAGIAASGPIVTVKVIAAGGDILHFRNAGHSIDGPIPDTTIAISLSKDVRTAESLGLFGNFRALCPDPTDDLCLRGFGHGSWKGVRV